MIGVRHVRSGLGVDADGVEGDKGGVDGGGDDGVEDVADVHDAFAKEQEEGENGDDDVEACDAVIADGQCCALMYDGCITGLKGMREMRTYN